MQNSIVYFKKVHSIQSLLKSFYNKGVRYSAGDVVISWCVFFKSTTCFWNLHSVYCTAVCVCKINSPSSQSKNVK